jgi:ATP-grasp domain
VQAEKNRARILLLDEGWNQTIHVAAGLAQANCEVTVMTSGARHTGRKTGRIRWVAAPAVDTDEYLAQVSGCAATFDNIVPMTEDVLRRLWHAAPAWADRLYPTLAPWQLRLCLNKYDFIAHMAMRGIGVAKFCHIDIETQALQLVDALGLPLVIKGVRGAAGRHVRIIETVDVLHATLARVRAVGGEWFAQAYIPGPTYLFAGLFVDGAPVRMYAGEKMSLFPLRTGPAISLRSTNDPRLIRTGLNVMRELRLSGLASIDLMQLSDGEYCPLEINPRPWGSIAAAATANVDLFSPLAACLAGHVLAPELHYAADVGCRIFPRYLLSPSHQNLTGLVTAVRDSFGKQGQDWWRAISVVDAVKRLQGASRHYESIF